MTILWGILRGMAPWHFVLAAVIGWSSWVGVKAYRAGGAAATKKIETAANANVAKAETARAKVRAAEKKRPPSAPDPDRRD